MLISFFKSFSVDQLAIAIKGVHLAIGIIFITINNDVSAQWYCPPGDEIPVADTLEASQYLPLTIGNTGDYVTSISAFQTAFRHKVIGDTLIEGIGFSKIQQILFSTGTSSVIENDTSYFYRSIRKDSLLSWTEARGIAFTGDILSKDFYSAYDTEVFTDGSRRVGGCYAGTINFLEEGIEISKDLAAIKSFSSNFESRVYGYGIGEIGSNIEVGVITHLIYAKLDTLEIGTPIEEVFQIEGDTPVADTLDWRGYYPLEIGNQWQYETVDDLLRSSFERWHITKDTLVLNTLYYTLEYNSVWHNGETISAPPFLIRYDTLGAGILLFNQVDGDSVVESQWSEVPCGLNASFNSDSECELDTYRVQGMYDVEYDFQGDTKIFPAEKSFITLGGGKTFISGLGLTKRGIDGSTMKTSLVYAVIGSDIYGSPVISTSRVADENKAQALGITVFPNPLSGSDQLQAHVQSPATGIHHFRIFNLLGQEIVVFSMHLDNPVNDLPLEEHIGDLPNGIYFIEVVTSNYRAFTSFNVRR